MRRLALLAAVAAAPLLGAAGPARIYIAPDDHTDYLWTADAPTYKKTFLGTLDYYLKQIDATAGRPSDRQMRWNTDGSLWVETYEKNRTEAQFARLMRRIADGHISMPINTLVPVFGATPAEAVLRDGYYAGRLERRFNVRFPLAYAMEEQVLPLGLGSLWAGSGARWTWKGVCACATAVPDSGNREFDAYWWTGRDGQRLLMKWNSLGPALAGAQDRNQGIGGYAEARFPGEVVDYIRGSADFAARYPYSVAGAFGQGWDDVRTLVPLTDTLRSFPSVAAAKTQPGSSDVIVSNELDYFADFEAVHGASLPSQSVTFGNEWNLPIAVLPETSARMKRAIEGLRGAEALAALVSLKVPAFMTGREPDRDAAFTAMGVYYEHDIAAITSPGNVPKLTRETWQKQQATTAGTYVTELRADGLRVLGGLIPTVAGETRVFVFNPLSWSRSAVVDYAYPGTGRLAVVNVADGSEVPAQVSGSGTSRRVRFSARGLPALGYGVYRIEARAGTFGGFATVSAGAGTIETSRYRVTLGANGAITSLIDKSQGGAEFVAAVDGAAANDPADGGAGSLRVGTVGPVSASLVATVPGPVPRTATVTLYRDLDRVDVADQVNALVTAPYLYRFGFNLAQPDTWHEEVGAVIHAKLAPEGHYSARGINARYDWQTLNHFVDMMDGGGARGITLTAGDAYFMRLGRSRADFLDTATPQISVLAAGNVSDGNVPTVGDAAFSTGFSLRPHGARDLTAAMRTALEQQNPALVGAVTGDGTAPYPAAGFSMLGVSNPNVLVWAVKPAEEARGGVILRVWNQAGTDQALTVTPGAGIALSAARRVTHIETDIGAATVTGGALAAVVGHDRMETYRLGLSAP